MVETFAIVYGCFFILTCMIWTVLMRLNFILSQSFRLKLIFVTLLLFVAIIVQWAIVWGEILIFGFAFVGGFLIGILCLIAPLYGICFALSQIQKIDFLIALKTMFVSFLLSLIILLSFLNLLFFLFRMEVF